MKALSHPLRVRLLTILSQRVACPREMANELGLEIAAVSYHCRQLEKAGLVEIVHEEPVRGSVRHDYRSLMRPFLDDSEWAALSPETRAAISAYGIGEIFGEVTDAMEAGTFDTKTDRHLSRTSLRLDEKGWKRVAEIQNIALQEILNEQVNAVREWPSLASSPPPRSPPCSVSRQLTARRQISVFEPFGVEPPRRLEGVLRAGG